MVNRAAELETDELRFFDSITDAAAGFDFVDVAFSSGTLQCVPNAKQALQEILNPQPRFVVLARLGLTAAAVELVTIHETRLSHNGPGPLPPGCKDGTTRYPFIFPVQSEIESILSKQYRIILSAPDPSGVFPVNDEPLIGMGYIGRISDSLPEFATLKAMGYSNKYFVSLVIKQAIFLSLLGFVPALITSWGMFELIQWGVGLPMLFTPWRIAVVLSLTTAMCLTSGLLALRRLLSADPASLF